MTQLETNTSELTELTASINTRHDSALELTQRALKVCVCGGGAGGTRGALSGPQVVGGCGVCVVVS